MQGSLERCDFPSVHSSLENSVSIPFSLIACTPMQVVRHVISDSDVCKVDLDMQMSFVNAAPWV